MPENEKLSKETHEAFVQVVNEKFARQDDENDRQNKRIEILEKSIERINGLIISVEKIAVSTENMAKELTKQGERLEAIEKEPAENWKKMLWYLLTFVLGAVLSFTIAKIGLQ